MESVKALQRIARETHQDHSRDVDMLRLAGDIAADKGFGEITSLLEVLGDRASYTADRLAELDELLEVDFLTPERGFGDSILTPLLQDKATLRRCREQLRTLDEITGGGVAA